MAGRGKKKYPGVRPIGSRWQARYYISKGNRPSKMFDTAEQASEWREKELYKKRHGITGTTTIHPANMTMDMWFDYWKGILGRENDVKYNTMRSYSNYYKHQIAPIIGGLLLGEVIPLHCEQVLLCAKDKGTVNGSLQKIRSIMKSMLDEAVRKGLLESNPVSRIKCIKQNESKYAEKEKRIFSRDEQRSFLQVGGFSEHYDAFVFALYTGVRCGELSALKWSDIDWINRTIRITGTLYWDEQEKRFYENAPKTKCGRRTIPLRDEAYDVLRRVKQNRKVIAMPGVDGETYSRYVFLNKDGKPTRNNAYNKSLSVICKHMGVPSISMHGLRHTFATRCIESGIMPKTLQTWLGHSSIKMTMDLYVHITAEESATEMKKLVI